LNDLRRALYKIAEALYGLGVASARFSTSLGSAWRK
jgi:hypothetical protein